MPRYGVSILYDACAYVVVDAESPKAAKDKAMSEAPHVSLCHQCSSEVEVNDPYDTGEPEEVSIDTPLTADEDE